MAKLPSAADLIGSRPRLAVAGGVSAARPEPIPRLGQEAEGILALGKSIGGVGEDVATATLREKERFDQTSVEDAFNQLREKQLDLTLGDENGFTKLRGGDAVKRPVLKEWGDRFDEQSKQIEDGLSDEGQKERFRLRSGIARASYVGDIMRHVNHEADQYAQNVYKGTMDLETRSALASWGDSNAIGVSLARIDSAVKSEAERAGWSPEATAAARLHAQSALHSGVIGQALEAGDTAYAQSYYEANKGAIDPTVVKTLGKAVADGVQKELANGYQGRFVGSRNDLKSLSALETEVAGDKTLDEDRRNVLMGRIGGRMDLLQNRAAHEYDQRMRTLQRQINDVNRITLAGYEPSTEQMLPLIAAAKGTELEGEVRQMIGTANATKAFRKSTPQQQEATITALEAQARKDPTKFDVTVVSRFKSIYANQQQELKSDPVSFAARQGLVAQDTAAAKPLDLSNPSQISEQLRARFDLTRALGERYQAPFKPLTKEETDTLVGVLRKATPDQKATYFAQLANASGDDFNGYKALMAQIAPDDPVTAHAGIMAGRGRLSTDAGFKPDPGQATNVAALILGGQSILHPNRKEDGTPEKGKLWPMPKDEDLDKSFQSEERDAFAGNAQARNGFLQTAKAIYAARSVEAGDSSGVLNSGRWQEAIRLSTGGIERWNGKSILMPWGMPKGDFKDGLYRRIDDMVGSGQIDPKLAGQLKDLPLESVGDGRYVFRAGDGVMVTPMPKFTAQGKPVLPNADGTGSTERTITIEMDGRHMVLPTIIGGRRYTPDQAVELLRQGKHAPIAEFNTAEEADRFARERTARLSDELRQRPIIIDFNASPAVRFTGTAPPPPPDVGVSTGSAAAGRVAPPRGREQMRQDTATLKSLRIAPDIK